MTTDLSPNSLFPTETTAAAAATAAAAKKDGDDTTLLSTLPICVGIVGLRVAFTFISHN